MTLPWRFLVINAVVFYGLGWLIDGRLGRPT